MNIQNFQNQYRNTATVAVNTWLNLHCTYTDKENLFKYLRWACIRSFSAKIQSAEADFIHNLSTARVTRDTAVDKIVDLFYLQMLRYSKQDQNISISFKTNCYNSRIKNFLNSIHAALVDIEHMSRLE